jgi:hypothetical protein
MIKLMESGVDFNQDAHTYTLDGKELQGITGMISRQLFPDKYSNVSQEVLNKAAERGSMVHEQIELYDAGIIDKITNDELSNYAGIKTANGLTTIANEYIVTDKEYFASAIDLVFERDGKIVLADIKTTYKLDEVYVMWQLSIYAYLFELQNPGLYVYELYGLWLRGKKSEFVPIKRISPETIKKLLEAEIAGEQFSYTEVTKYDDNYPIQIINAEKALADLDKDLNELKEQKEQLLNGLLTIMVDNHIKSFKGKLITLSRKAASTRESIDSKKLKDEYPDIYESCKKVSQIKESLTLKVN